MSSNPPPPFDTIAQADYPGWSEMINSIVGFVTASTQLACTLRSSKCCFPNQSQIKENVSKQSSNMMDTSSKVLDQKSDLLIQPTCSPVQITPTAPMLQYPLSNEMYGEPNNEATTITLMSTRDFGDADTNSINGFHNVTSDYLSSVQSSGPPTEHPLDANNECYFEDYDDSEQSLDSDNFQEKFNHCPDGDCAMLKTDLFDSSEFVGKDNLVLECDVSKEKPFLPELSSEVNISNKDEAQDNKNKDQIVLNEKSGTYSGSKDVYSEADLNQNTEIIAGELQEQEEMSRLHKKNANDKMIEQMLSKIVFDQMDKILYFDDNIKNTTASHKNSYSKLLKKLENLDANLSELRSKVVPQIHKPKMSKNLKSRESDQKKRNANNLTKKESKRPATDLQKDYVLKNIVNRQNKKQEKDVNSRRPLTTQMELNHSARSQKKDFLPSKTTAKPSTVSPKKTVEKIPASSEQKKIISKTKPVSKDPKIIRKPVTKSSKDSKIINVFPIQEKVCEVKSCLKSENTCQNVFRQKKLSISDNNKTILPKLPLIRDTTLKLTAAQTVKKAAELLNKADEVLKPAKLVKMQVISGSIRSKAKP